MSQLIKKEGKHALVTVTIVNEIIFNVRNEQLSDLRRFVTTK
jgi:uncharacterized protein YfaS (alpha-2-macroglobulin family)